MSGGAAARPPGVRATHDPARLEALVPEWSALVDAAGTPSPFSAPEWLVPWWRRFGGRRGLWNSSRRGAARDGSTASSCSRRAPGFPGLRRWQLLGNGLTGADGLDLLVRAGAGRAVRGALAEALAAGGWDLLDLEDLPFGSPTAAALRQVLAPRGVAVETARRFACPGFAIRGTFEAHVQELRRRETYGRRVRWLARQPGFRIDVATTPDQAAPALEDFLRLHRLRWKGRAGATGSRRARRRTSTATPRVASPRAAGCASTGCSSPAARSRRCTGFEAGGTFHYYQSGYDPEWAARSPGLVLTGRTVEDAYARGLRYYDFLRGEEAYKLDWTADRRELCAVRLRAPSLRASAGAAADEAWRAARGLARAVAPERAWAALRRARRGIEAGGAGHAGAAGVPSPEGRV